MPVRSAEAEWSGDLRSGRGHLTTETSTVDADYGFASRFESGPGTNPEELIGAAHAGCFSMAFAGALAAAGSAPERISTRARVHIEKVGDGFAITRIELATEATVPGIEEARFQEVARASKDACPVSKALTGVPIELRATLKR
jgi:lipoyl-dependent peroxiredoxin